MTDKRTAWNSTLAPGKPLERRTPLRSRGRMKRTPIRKRNEKRARARRENDRVYGSYHAWIKTLPCHYAGEFCVGAVTGHHVEPVRYGRVGGEDYANEIPVCVQHHDMAHRAALERETLAAIAREYAEKWGGRG